MINIHEVVETNQMIEKENLDVRTITLGISLLDCADSSLERTCEKIKDKIYYYSRNLVAVGEEISREYGIPIVNKRVSVTPISLVGAGCCKTPQDYVQIALALLRVRNDAESRSGQAGQVERLGRAAEHQAHPRRGVAGKRLPHHVAHLTRDDIGGD